VAASADAPQRRISGLNWRGHGTVLVAEDEEGVREVVARMLERLGYAVVLAEDGVAALERLEEAESSLRAVLLDISMPRMGGSEALEHIRERCPDLPVVLMSGYTEQDVAAKLLDRAGGAVAFLQKPFLPEDLTAALRQVSQAAQA
jgi:CheY-like chemotaxis protein